MISTSSYGSLRNCLIKSNDPRKQNLWTITHTIQSTLTRRKEKTEIPKNACQQAFFLRPLLSFKKVSTVIAFTRYLLIVTALLRQHKSALRPFEQARCSKGESSDGLLPPTRLYETYIQVYICTRFTCRFLIYLKRDRLR